MAWFRMYDSIAGDHKVMQLDSSHFKTWVLCLCNAKKNGGKLDCIPVLAFELRLREDVCQKHLDLLLQVGLLDKEGDVYQPHNWAKFQYESDNSTERSKRHRERKKEQLCDVDATLQERPSNALRIQSTDTDTECVAVATPRAAAPPPRQQQPEFEPFDNEPDLTTVVSEAVEAVAQHWPYLGNVPNAKRAWEREAARAVEGGLVWCDKIQRTALVHSLAHAACKRSAPNHYVPSLERWVQDGDYARKPPTPRESKNMSLADLLYPEDTSHAS